MRWTTVCSASGDGELEELWNALSMPVGLEAGEQVLDEADAARRADVTGQRKRLGGGGRGGLGFLQVEVAGGPVGEEDTFRLVPGGRQEAFAVGDELVGAAGVAEVREGLAGVHGE
jgi:6-phosphogluconate dehydrogenase (decarboxylating)